MEVTLPNEMWLEIFKNIDWRKLIQLRLVCRRFYDLIEDLLSKEWREVADDTILFECMTLTMQRAYPYHLVTFWRNVTDPVLWRGTYMSYKKWQKVLVNPETKDTIAPVFAVGGGEWKISCVCTFDKFIAIAFDNGSIANYTIEDINWPFYVAHQNSAIQQIEFWYSNGEVLVVTVGDDNLLRFWDLQNKTEISTRGIFANRIHYGQTRHFCIGEMNGILTTYERDGNHIKAGHTEVVELWEGERLMCHVLDQKYMTALSYIDGGTVMYLFDLIIEDGKLTRIAVSQEKDRIRLPEQLKDNIAILDMTTINFFFVIGEVSIGSTNYYEDEWHEYNLVQHFGWHVTSTALHAQVLMLGLEDGSVHLLHIDHYGDVMDLEEKIKNARKIQVDDEPILYITVMEVDTYPCIVAATRRRVHLLNFF